MRIELLAAMVALMPITAKAQSTITPHAGIEIIETGKNYETLLADLKAAVAANKMGVVTEAGPTEAAKQRGETIPGNRVVGVFRNDFAVTIIRAAPAAMIEPPVRFMVMEEPDGTATLAYKVPSSVFAPYMDEGSDALKGAAAELDTIFAAIAAEAAAQ